MEAIILAAGSAQRMWPLSAEQHKGLIPIAGASMLARMVGDLVVIGAAPITIVTGYRRDEVEAHLRGQFPHAPLQFVHNTRYAETNNIVSLLLALEAAPRRGDILLLECDVILAPGILGRLASGASRNIALLDRYETGMDGTVVRLRDGIVTELVLPTAQDERFDYRDTFKTLNLYRFTEAFCHAVLQPSLREHVDAGATDQYYEAVLAGLGDLAPFAIAAEILDGEDWAELDDPNDLAAARFDFEPEARAAILDRAQGGHWAFDHQDHALLRNVHFPTPAMLAALRHALPELLFSYGSSQAVVDEKLGWFLRCPAEAVIALSGGSQAFPVLRTHFAGQSIAIPEPTFGEYPRMFPGATRYLDESGVDLGDLDRAAASHDVLVVVSPNNPSGTNIPAPDLLALASRHPATTILVDESFLPFSDEVSLLDATGGALPRNVLVLASLSKSLGVPGARLGYLAGGDPRQLDALRAELPIWHVGGVAEHLLELLLKFRPQLAAALAQTKRDRAQLAAGLRGCDAVAAVQVGGGNFVLAKLHGPPETAESVRLALLADRRISVKNVTAKFGDAAPWLRIGVRTDAENRSLVEAIAACSQAVTA